MKTLDPVDVVIVGGGWSGMVMAKEIATRSSLSVLLLERGGNAAGSHADEQDEVDTAIRSRYMANAANGIFTHRRSIRDRANAIRQYAGHHAGTGLGGSSAIWGGTSPRFLPEAFTLATHLREKFGEARLPPDLTVQDWGFTWNDFEPYYWRAEQMMGVSGKAGNLQGKKIAGGNIFEGPRSHDFPNPPHAMPCMPELFAKAARDLGYHPFPMPSATLSQTYKNPDGITRAGCLYKGHCSLFRCPVQAKADPVYTILPVLRKCKNFSVRTGCQVRRVVHRDGTAEGVTYVDDSGNEMLQPASTVVLSAWALNNARLLMLSGIGDPYDPATGKGTLGRNATINVYVRTEFFLDKPLNGFMGAGGQGMSIGDFQGDPPEADIAAGALRGGIILAMSAGSTPITSFGRVPQGEVKSNWGPEWKKAALKWNDRYASFLSSANHFAYRGNYMDLDPTYRDKWGDPLLRLTMDWTDTDRKEEAMLSRVEVAIAKAMGATGVAARLTTNNPPGSGTDHMQGGAILGTSPETSVVNPCLQHWKIPNLWVVGGSAFPQNDSQPTLTLVALSYWAADAFVDRYLKHPGALA